MIDAKAAAKPFINMLYELGNQEKLTVMPLQVLGEFIFSDKYQ